MAERLQRWCKDNTDKVRFCLSEKSSDLPKTRKDGIFRWKTQARVARRVNENGALKSQSSVLFEQPSNNPLFGSLNYTCSPLLSALLNRLKNNDIRCVASSRREYTVGMMTNVRNVETVSPKIMVTASGRQNSALSAPIMK